MSRCLAVSLVFLFACSSPETQSSRAAVSAAALNTRELATVEVDNQSMQETEWVAYAGTTAANKFSPANLINKSNVQKLKVAWRLKSVDALVPEVNGLTSLYNESTPLMVKGRLYFVTPFGQVVSADPATGQVYWRFDSHVYRRGYPVGLGFVNRGLAYQETKDGSILYFASNDSVLFAIKADTGSLLESFGEKGRVDLKLGLANIAKNSNYANTSPPLVCNDTVIVGSTVSDEIGKLNNPRGDVRGYDLLTGKKKWTFRTVPARGEFGVETWENESWKRMTNANVWAPMSADLETGTVYLPVSTPTNDFYGGERKGDGLFGESLVAVNCSTGQRRWHFQLVHHGLWDYDLPAAPVLFDVKTSRGVRKLVAQVTKQAFTYVFDRVTGEPIWPIEERAVPQSTIPGEKSSATQPIPTKPLPFDRQGVRVQDLIDFTPELRAEALEIVNRYDYGPLFTPPTLKGSILLPGLIGGASWAGAAYNPLTQKLYVPSMTQPNVTELDRGFLPGHSRYTRNLRNAKMVGPQGGALPLFKPPYGRLTAIDMVSGDHAWMQPIGRGPKDHPALAGVKLSQADLGWARRTHVLTTPELVFAMQEGSTEVVGTKNFVRTLLYQAKNHEAFLRAFDSETGEKVAEIALPANAFGAPMTYIYNGKQYIVYPYGGAGLEAGWIALAL